MSRSVTSQRLPRNKGLGEEKEEIQSKGSITEYTEKNMIGVG
jgi:hypothetical protein